MVTLPNERVEAAIEALGHAPAFKTLWQSETIYLDGMRHALGDEDLSSPVKLKEIQPRLRCCQGEQVALLVLVKGEWLRTLALPALAKPHNPVVESDVAWRAAHCGNREAG